MRIEIGVSDKCVAIAQSLARRERPSAIERLRHQRRDVIHQTVMIETDPIPFKQRKLGVVPPAALARAEYFAYLVNRSAARCEQAFHRELGRCLQVTRSGFVARRGGLSDEAV